MQIAVLGWGSLVWDPDTLKQYRISGFRPGGPELPLEFSRVSSDGRLTLVIDEEYGQKKLPTRYAVGEWPNLDSAKLALFEREMRRKLRQKEKIEDSIGYTDRQAVEASINSDLCHKTAHDLILPWLQASNFDGVIWTALPSNFREKRKFSFSIDRAVTYLQSLPLDCQEKALEYFEKAPEEVQTPLRIRLVKVGLIGPNSIIGTQNLKEALGFLKDWVTALIAICTAGIGALAAVVSNLHHYRHYQRWIIAFTLLCLGFSVWWGLNVLYMLPGCAQRKPYPKQDIYSLRTLDRSLGFWVRLFWAGFFGSIISLLLFYASSMGRDFFYLGVLVVLIAIIIIWGPAVWSQRTAVIDKLTELVKKLQNKNVARR
jgi:hypothetical protein